MRPMLRAVQAELPLLLVVGVALVGELLRAGVPILALVAVR
jgi:hypothetical protein